MTVSELMTLLQKYPSDTRVVVLGYEEGYDDITLVKEIAIEPVDQPKWFIGRYDDALPENGDTAERVVLLHGRNTGE